MGDTVSLRLHLLYHEVLECFGQVSPNRASLVIVTSSGNSPAVIGQGEVMKQAQVSLASPLGRGRPATLDPGQAGAEAELFGSWQGHRGGSPRHRDAGAPALLKDHHSSSETITSDLDRNFVEGKLEGNFLETLRVCI